MKVEPYLFFEGNCEEAMQFYKRALGATEIKLMRYKESPEPLPPGMVPPGWENKIMHSYLRIGDTELMASDGKSPGGGAHHGFSLTLSVPDAAAAKQRFDALAEGGQVVMSGANGTLLRGRPGALVDESRVATLSDLHAVSARGGQIFAVGGNYFAPAPATRHGVVAHYGDPVSSTLK